MEPDESRLAAWAAMLHGQSALTGVLDHELVAEVGLPLTWYDVLVNLHAAGGRLRMQELARSIVLSKSGLTRLVDRMVAAGLVAREPCEGDRRGLLAVLTDRGLATLRTAAPVHLRGIESYFGRHVSPEEAEVVRSVFERVLAALRDDGTCDAVDAAADADADAEPVEAAG
jgi:DNA-binding MarR family transcriptional regulator